MCRSGKGGLQSEGTAGPKVLRQEHIGIFQEKQRNYFTEIGEAEEEANFWGRKSSVLDVIIVRNCNGCL